MTATLSTQIHRSLFALPLLAVGLAAAFTPALPASSSTVSAAPASRVELPAPARDGVAMAAGSDCDATPRPAGALGLARMPGDIGPLGRRLRCAM